MLIRDEPETPESFSLDRETLAYIVLKARAFDVLLPPDDPSDGSGAIDDRFVDALEDEADNPARSELRAAIVSLDVDAKACLVALTWLGRGDYEAADWDEALATARERANGATARYLMGMPLLGDLLEDGAEKLGVSLAAEEALGLADPDLDTRSGD